MNKEVGKLIQLYREKAHISQEELAETIGLSITAISNIERGVNYPTLENFIKIANTIHAPADELLEPDVDSLSTSTLSPYFFIKTNLLYDLLTMVNVSV